MIKRVARFASRKWPEPIYELRRELGLPRGTNPLFDAKHSPNLVLALFSRVLGVKQKDWPPNTLIAGFAYYDADAGNAQAAAASRKICRKRRAACGVYARLGRGSGGRRLLRSLGEGGDGTGRARGVADWTDPRNRPTQPLPDSICVAEYAPYSALFSRASLVVHQGGVGTTAQCLRAGKPMLIMPYSHDQPDNARRMKRLGVAKVIQKASYTPKKVIRKLRKMLDDPKLAGKARAVAEQLQGEDGVKTACDALEGLYAQDTASAGLIRSIMTEPRTSSFGQVDVIQATIEEIPVVANLLELYAHDFSEFHSIEPGPDGRFGYPDLPLYWSESGRHAFLIKVDGKLAGFALIREILPVSGTNSIWDMAEFFVLRAYRRGGVRHESCQGALAAIPGDLAGARDALESAQDSNSGCTRIDEFAGGEVIFVQRRESWRGMGRLLVHVDCAALIETHCVRRSTPIWCCMLESPYSQATCRRVGRSHLGNSISRRLHRMERVSEIPYARWRK